MKKFIALLSLSVLFILMASEVVCQFSLSAGVNRRSEYVMRGNLKHFMSFQSGSRRFTHDYFNLKVDYQKKWWMLSGALTYLSKKNVQTSGTVVISATNQGSTINTYHARSDYSYLGLRLSPNALFEGQGIIFKKATAGIILGAFFQSDFLVGFSEYDHSIVTSGGQLGFVNYDSFQALDVQKVFLSGGIRLARRTTFKYFFIEFNTSLGFSEHMSSLIHTHGNSYPSHRPIFFETGASMGITFSAEFRAIFRKE